MSISFSRNRLLLTLKCESNDEPDSKDDARTIIYSSDCDQ